MKNIYLMGLLAIAASSTDKQDYEGTLQDALAGEEPVRDNVIACAASNENDDLVSVFLYPRDGATNLRYYETPNAQADKNNFEGYYQLEIPLVDVFNGYLKKFEVSASEDNWLNPWAEVGF